jgi:O-antigen/teichoic acid export membrane protein
VTSDPDPGVAVAGALRSVVRGAAFVAVGTLVGLALNLFGRAVFTRAYEPADYGAFAIAFTVVTVGGSVATLGLRTGLARQVAYGNADADEQGEAVGDPGTLVAWALVVTAASGAALGAAAVLGADAAAAVLGEQRYATAFRVGGAGLPAFALITVATAVFRGYSRTRERVLFRDVLRNGALPLFLVPVAGVGLPAGYGLAALPASLWVTALAFLAYLVRENTAGFRTGVVARLRSTAPLVGLLRFSFPLLLSSLLIQVMAWTDVVMLGYFAPPAVVGTYEAVRPLYRAVQMVWGAMLFMYVPLVSEYHAKDATGALRRAYAALTKWFTALTFPVVAVFMLYPATTLEAVYGPSYAAGAPALRVLAATMFLHSVMGPNGATLAALGRTRVLAWANFFAAVVNVALNLALIPRLGLTGAALATATAFVLRNLARVGLLYRIDRVHSFTRAVLAPFALAGAAAAAGAGLLGSVDAALLPAVAVGVAAAYLLAFLAAGVEREDRELAAAARERVAALRRT